MGREQRNYGFNTFCEGINMTLDIIMPLLDKESQKKIKAKILMMMESRYMRKEKKRK